MTDQPNVFKLVEKWRTKDWEDERKPNPLGAAGNCAAELEAALPAVRRMIVALRAYVDIEEWGFEEGEQALKPFKDVR